LKGLPITSVYLEDEMDADFRLGYHEETHAYAWVESTTGWEDHPIVRRRIRVYGDDIESVRALYREILDGRKPTPVNAPEPLSEEEPAES
jgi:hypothetical protein